MSSVSLDKKSGQYLFAGKEKEKSVENSTATSSLFTNQKSKMRVSHGFGTSASSFKGGAVSGERSDTPKRNGSEKRGRFANHNRV